ncbi:MAG: AarF/UbiB family protein [Gemmatimonadota bacterium]
MSRFARTFGVARRLLPFVFAFLRDRRRWVVLGRPARRTEEQHQRRADRLSATIADLGPTFIKLAQLLSTRADILPEPYLSAIARLQDRVPPVPSAGILAVLEGELGKPVDEVLEDFDREPIAAASLGQVHRARAEGRDVVVKVLRPGVEDLVALDLDISFRLLYWLNVVFPNHHVRALTATVREFSVKVREEMDFRSEAENMRRFHHFFDNDRRFRVPEVLPAFTRQRVLVMEFTPGTKIDQLQTQFAEGRLDFRQVMENLTGLYLRMMMVDGFLHADPHPGNLLVQDDGTIVILDWGMVLDVPRWTRESILHIALAVEREDLDAIINEMYKLGMMSPEVSRGEVREAALEILRIMERAQGSNRERIEEIVHEIYDTFYTWPLILPQELVYFFRASVLLEGIGILYDRNFDGLGLIRVVIRGLRRQILDTTRREPTAMARDAVGEVGHVVRAVLQILERAEREELRVRMHPRDVQAQERFLHLQARRLLLSIFASVTAVISSVIYLAVRNVWLLAGGLVISLLMFLLVLFIPTHLLENPLRHARGIRPGGSS